jgi:HEAT repeat protein
MTEEKMSEKKKNKPDKILEKPLMGGIAVPIAIILFGALVIFGVSKMLSSDRTYKDLVAELHSKTFGNRWVAAYELSKVMASDRIPKSDFPWLVTNLSDIYKTSVDARTRNFIILALSSLDTGLIVPTLELALDDEDEKAKLNAVVAIGNQKLGIKIDWSKLNRLIKSDDVGIQQVAIYALAQHQRAEFQKDIAILLAAPDKSVRYAAAIGLINFKNTKNINLLKEILALDHKTEPIFNAAQVEALKLNIINALRKNSWAILNAELEKVASHEKNTKLAIKAKEALNLLKN